MRRLDTTPRDSVSETFFVERGRFLLSWNKGPILGTVHDSLLHIDVPANDEETPLDVRISLNADAVLFVESREVFVSVHTSDRDVAVTETSLRGRREQWHVLLPPAGHGPWTLIDVMQAWDETGEDCLVLTVEDVSGAIEFHQICANKQVRIHRPATPGQLLHWDLRYDAIVIREDQGPWDTKLHLERPLSHAAPRSIVARWVDGWEGRGTVIVTPQDAESRVELWDLRTSSHALIARPQGQVDDARIMRDGSGRILIVVTEKGTDSLNLWDPENDESSLLPLNGTGRTRIRVAGQHGIGMYRVSTLGGSFWIWLNHNRSLNQVRGEVPAYDRQATLSHTWYGRTPVLQYLPEQSPVAVVVSLHGGPESLERDELRWDGLYRELLDSGIAVIGLNYCGSAGYGPGHTQRAWRAWPTAFQEDLESCLAAAREWGIFPADIALLGGSFGGSLALLGCVLQNDLAGGVASAPLIDIRRHAETAASADQSYRNWFGTRFELSVSATAAQRVFDPEYLSTTAPGQRVILVHGSEDEVTQWQHSKLAAGAAVRRGLPWKLVTEAGVGHTPTNLAEARNRYKNIRSALSEILGIALGAKPAPDMC